MKGTTGKARCVRENPNNGLNWLVTELSQLAVNVSAGFGSRKQVDGGFVGQSVAIRAQNCLEGTNKGLNRGPTGASQYTIDAQRHLRVPKNRRCPLVIEAIRVLSVKLKQVRDFSRHQFFATQSLGKRQHSLSVARDRRKA
jgi:hypothetical protein